LNFDQPNGSKRKCRISAEKRPADVLLRIGNPPRGDGDLARLFDSVLNVFKRLGNG
jgi:hypothetical protein